MTQKRTIGCLIAEKAIVSLVNRKHAYEALKNKKNGYVC